MTQPPVRQRSRRRTALASLAFAGLSLLSTTAQPAAAAGVGEASPSPGRLDVVIRHDGNGSATDPNVDSLVQLSRVNGAWQNLVNIGGNVHRDSEISVASASAGTLMLAVRGTDDMLQVRPWSATTGWGSWTNLASGVTGGPSITAFGSGKLAVVWRDGAGKVSLRQWSSSAGWGSAGQLDRLVTANTGPAIQGTSAGALTLTYLHTSFDHPVKSTFSGTADPTLTASWGSVSFAHLLTQPAVATPSVGVDLMFGGAGTGRTVERYQTSPAQFASMGGPVAGFAATARPGESTLPNTPASAWSRRLSSSSADQADLIWRSDTGCLQTHSKTDPAPGGVWTAASRIPTTLSGTRCVWPGRMQPPAPKPSDYGSEALTPGTIRYFGRTDGDQAWKDWFNPTNTPLANRTWLNSKVWRLEGFDGYTEPATSWFSGALAYYQLYTIEEADAVANPDWVLRDSAGNPLYAADGETPHRLKAGNIFNAGYRQYQINRINTLFADGSFRGLWLDNVNLELGDSGLVEQVQWVLNTDTPNDPNDYHWDWDATRVGALSGYAQKAYAKSGTFPAGENCTTATVPAGGQLSITDSCWAVGIAAFVNQVKTSLPAGKELLTNTPYYRTLRNVETYDFYRDANGRVVSGLPTAAGRSVVDSATYVDLEASFWNNGEATGNGPAGDVLTGPGTNGYSTDSIFRWIDAVHARGKGIVADSKTAGDLGSLSEGAQADSQTSLRIDEFNLAGYLITTNGKDGIGGYNPTNTNWPAISGTGGASLYDMNIGAASALPTGATASGGGTNGRGIIPPVLVAPATINDWWGNRLYIRKFTRTDGKKVFVLLNEASTGQDNMTGPSLKYTIPATGCSDMTRSASAPASYRTLNPTTSEITLRPRSAAFYLCN